jgi:prepilin-type N-terminal cleavage/methylation domain-containing protein
MGRLKKGLSLLELIIAITILSVVLMTASSILISFKKFYFDFTDKQNQTGEVYLGTLEEIVSRIKTANRVTVSTTIPPAPVAGVSYNSTINMYIDENDPHTADNYADDTLCSYEWNGQPNVDGNIQRSITPAGGATNTQTIAYHITYFVGTALSVNQISVRIDIKPSNGAIETFTAISSARSLAAE